MLSRKEGSEITQAIHIVGGATTEATITGLETATAYFVKVAAVNSAGIGVYSEEIMVIREGIVKCLLSCYNFSHILSCCFGSTIFSS